MALIDKVKENWLVGLIILGATCVATTWYVANEVLVKPRDFTIEQQKTVIADLRQKLRDLQDEKDKSASDSPRPPSTAAPAPGSGWTINPLSATILTPTWIEEGRPLLVFDDQVQITVSSANRLIRSATIDLDLPSGRIHWGVLGVGETKTFDYRDQTYYFRIIDVSDDKAKITIAKKL